MMIMMMMMMRRTLEGRDTCHSLLELLYCFYRTMYTYIVVCLGRHETFVLTFPGIACILGLDNLYICSNG